jgi:hypothetical protein
MKRIRYQWHIAVLSTLIVCTSFGYWHLHASVVSNSLGENVDIYSELPLHDNVLGKGKGILFTPTYSTVRIDNGYEVRFLQGAIYVVHSKASVTVAALSSPALLIDSMGQSLLLPKGLQITLNTPNLPSNELLDRWWNAVKISVVSQQFISEALATIPPRDFPSNSIEQETEKALRLLGNCENFSCKADILHLLATTKHAAVSQMIVEQLSNFDHDIAVLHFAHSRADHYPILELSGDYILTLFYGCIYSRCSNGYMSALQESAKVYVLENGFTQKFLETLVHVSQVFTSDDYIRTYPHRYEQLQQFTQSLALPYEKTLSLSLPTIALEEFSSASSQASEVHITVGVLTDDELLERSREILDSLQALYTVNTRITPSGINRVHVENIALPTATAEQMFAFDLHVKSGEVSAIQTSDTMYPNRVLLEDFVLWLRTLR